MPIDGDILKELRRDQGYNQEEMGRIFGLSVKAFEASWRAVPGFLLCIV